MVDLHRKHRDSILGGYCFFCRCKCQSNIPGWTRPLRGPSVGYEVWDINKITGIGYTEAIIWLDGYQVTPKSRTVCDLCHKHCKYPVLDSWHRTYKEIGYVREM